LVWQCSNQSTKLFHTSKIDLVIQTDDTVALDKFNSVITQTDAKEFEALMLAKVVISYENQFTT